MALETLEGLDKIGEEKVLHLETSIPRENYLELIKKSFILHGKENNTITFKIQDGPINEVGKNGCQVTDMLALIKHIYEGLNKKFPCDENIMTIRYLNKALIEQADRTRNRKARNVEGFNKE